MTMSHSFSLNTSFSQAGNPANKALKIRFFLSCASSSLKLEVLQRSPLLLLCILCSLQIIISLTPLEPYCFQQDKTRCNRLEHSKQIHYLFTGGRRVLLTHVLSCAGSWVTTKVESTKTSWYDSEHMKTADLLSKLAFLNCRYSEKEFTL